MATLKIYNGSSWVAVGASPSGNEILSRSLQFFGDFRSLYVASSYWQLINMAQTGKYPSGVTVTSWYLDCSNASPTTQINANLKYCDALTGSAFPGANATLIATIDSTAGNSSATGLSTNVPAGKIVYLEFDADPTDYNTTWSLVINFTIN